MSWYKKHLRKVAALQGEWWIVNGNVKFADNSNSDYGHESIVIEHAQSIVKSAMRKDSILSRAIKVIFGRPGHYDEFDPIGAREYLMNWSDEMCQRGLLTEEESEDIYDTIVKRTGVDSYVLSIAMGSKSSQDTKLYAMKEWGWKRVATNNIELWQLTKGDTEDIVIGLHSAYGSECERESYNIEVHSNKMYYSGISYFEIESGPTAILKHRAFI